MNIPNPCMPSWAYRELNAREEERFRQWARNWYKNRAALDEPSSLWHPVVLDELRKLDAASHE